MAEPNNAQNQPHSRTGAAELVANPPQLRAVKLEVVHSANSSTANPTRRLNSAGAAPAAATAFTSPTAAASLTVEKYILLLRQKDERIRKLEEENRAFRSTLLERTKVHQTRVDELVGELERYAENIARLQSHLAMTRGIKAVAQQHQPAVEKKEPANKKTRKTGNNPLLAVAAEQNGHTGKGGSAAHPAQQKTAAPTQLQPVLVNAQQHQPKPTDADEICAALQSFVERNRQQPDEDVGTLMGVLNGAAGTVPQQAAGDEDLFAAQLATIMADDPSLLSSLLLGTSPAGEAGSEFNGTGSANEMDPSSFLALLLNSAEADGTKGEEAPGGEQQPQEQQQNIDFEEVMQRVIGEAMNYGGSSSAPSGGPIAVGTSGNVVGRSNGGTKKKGSGGKSKQKGAAALAAGTPIALPKGTEKALETGEKGAAMADLSLLSPKSAAPSAGPHPPAAQAKPWTPEEQKLVRELEARIDENIVRLGSRAMNTAELAAQCTRLMRGYSIGQRLFARTVMVQVSQSQGSLSELLSKPRPWHKLTDKGREAFRRIFGWISDDSAIDLLCQLSPRKVALPEKLEHPDPESLLETGDGVATMMLSTSMGGTAELLTPKVEMGGGRAAKKAKVVSMGASADKLGTRCTMVVKSEPTAISPGEPRLRENSLLGSGGRWRHDDIPKEKIIDIYEAEKAKLLEKECHLERTLATSSSSATPSLSQSASPAINGGVKKVVRAESVANGEMEMQAAARSVCSPSSIASSGGEFPQLEQLFGRHSTRPELAAIQFERYSQLETEEVVRQVREYLTEEQVSQRQFGESVLGLSQGSVSDLLARPKAWQSLTNKGREPFIRMQMFLDERRKSKADADNGAQLPANDGAELELRLELPTDSSEPAASIPVNEQQLTEPKDGEEEEEEEEDADKVRSEFDDQQQMAASSSEAILQDIMAHLKEEKGERKAPEHTAKLQPIQGHALSQVALRSGADEVDTAEVARKVKAMLAVNGISQRAFGEHVLKMTSGCVSDLLTKPKPWVMLSYKGRESYTKMIEFLAEPGAVDRLKAEEQQRCAVNNALNALKAFTNNIGGEQQLNDSGDEVAAPATPHIDSQHQQLAANTSGGTFLKMGHPVVANTTSTPLSVNGGAAKRKATLAGTVSMVAMGDGAEGPAKKIPRFQRTIITERQKEALLFIYAHEQRPRSECIEQLGAKLGLTPRTVINWFHNYRTRQKAKEVKQEGDESSSSAQTLVSTTPTPAQVLTRALNATDENTANWFRELAELLRRHSDASVDVDSIGGSNYSSPQSPPSSEMVPITLMEGQIDTEEDGMLYGEEGEFEAAVSGVEGQLHIAEERQGDDEEEQQQNRAGSSTSASSPRQSTPSGAGASQLDKAIARMRNRLMAVGGK